MEILELKSIEKQGSMIRYHFTFSAGLADYYTENPFVIEYPMNIESVPDAVAAVPFVCNVLPVIWLTDSVLKVRQLDKAFFDCIPNVRKGYEAMFPEAVFAGRLEVENLIPCHGPASGNSAVFFSGGLDAVHTLINHLEERPALISIWGADIRFDNESGWEVVHNGIAEYARKYDLPDVVIHSALRRFDNEDALARRFSKHLTSGWWHDMKHGLGLLGHAAPYAYLHGLTTVYIASSNCPADGPVRCASNPLTDNYVRFVNARVVHDGFEFSRQDKVHNVVDYVARSADQVSLHVCFKAQSGNNCCQCEKCYRTMTGLIAEGADPTAYGFDTASENIPLMHTRMIKQKQLSPGIAVRQWSHIGDRMKANRKQIRRLPFWNDVKWMLKADFRNPQTIYISREKQVRQYLAQFKFYQLLHKLKAKR